MKHWGPPLFGSRSVRLTLAAFGVLAGAASVWAFIFDLSLVRLLHTAAAEHVDQEEFYDLVTAGDDEEAFQAAFEDGDELFETVFNALDGGGANVGSGQRFTRVPRADLNGTGQWARHTPSRSTGPNAQACNHCHNQPADDGAGPAAANVHRDPLHAGLLRRFIQRNPPHLFAAGAVQRLAEEISEELGHTRENAVALACRSFGVVTAPLLSKGISFGTLKVRRIRSNPCQVTVNTAGVVGVDSDLVVRPFQWKGSVAFLRDFDRGEAHNELGLQAVEFAGDDVDGDGDGVRDEMTIGDQTALAVYLAAQPRPTSKVELASLNLIPPLADGELAAITRGSAHFDKIGCAICHRPLLVLSVPIFSEPSQNPDYRDATFPAGQNPISRKVDPAFAVTFDLTQDQPDNVIEDESGNTVFRLGSLRKDTSGHGIVELYGDLRRHDVGSGLAEGIDEVGTGASMFLTENLWGVGSTAPYLHDGRATTLTEAILEHGGEAAAARTAFLDSSTDQQKDVIAFLDNLVLFKRPRR